MWWKFRDPWDVSFAKGVTAALEAQGEAARDDLYAFSNLVIDRYFRLTRETVKAFDPLRRDGSRPVRHGRPAGA